MKLEDLILTDENTGLQYIDPSDYFYHENDLETQEITKKYLDLIANHDIVRYVGLVLEYIEELLYAVEGYEMDNETQYNGEPYPKSVYAYRINKYIWIVKSAANSSASNIDFWNKCNKTLEDLYQLQEESSRYPSLEKLIQKGNKILCDYNGIKEENKND